MADLCPCCQRPGSAGAWRSLYTRESRVSAIITGNTHERLWTCCTVRERAAFGKD